MINKRRSLCSSKWFRKCFMDQYAQKAQQQGLRSRSWFKIQAIDRLDSLFYSGMTVVDLGSAPGGWSYYVSNKLGNTGNVIACDILPMRRMKRVKFLRGDCTNPNTLKVLYSWIGDRRVQVVLSDMSPNTTGISIIDVSKSIFLGNLALDICCRILTFGGAFVVKIFQGNDFEQYLYTIKSLFNVVKIRKPDSSKSSSREVYIVAKEHDVQR